MSEEPINPAVSIYQLMTGRWISHIIGVTAELGLADDIGKAPMSADELAASHGLHAPSVYRLLRALSSLGIFAEREDGRFEHSPLSNALRSDAPFSMRGICRILNRPWAIEAWANLAQTLSDGRPAFDRLQGKPLFDFLAQHPSEMAIFADAMGGDFTEQAAQAAANAYDFSGIRVLADIGGSRGNVLAAVLAHHPQLRGILFDLPGVMGEARNLLERRGVLARVALEPGSFFERVPAGADAYLLKHVLHDWNDADALRILRSVHAAATPGARLLLLESVISGRNVAQPAAILDLEMLAITGGRERTREEWERLMGDSGFRFQRVVPTQAGFSLLEAIRT